MSGWCEVERGQVGGRAGRDRRRRQAQAARAVRRSGSATATAPGPRRPSATSTLRRPLRRRAQPSVSRASSNGSRRTFESAPKETGTPRSQSSAAGRKPSPRLASVVGQAHTVEPRLRRAGRAPRGETCVACTTVAAVAEHAAVVEVLDRAQAELLERLLDLARLLAGVDVQRVARAGRVLGDRDEPLARHGAQRVRRVADGHERIARDRRRRGARRGRGRPRRCGRRSAAGPASARGPRPRARRRPSAARCGRRPRAPPR